VSAPRWRYYRSLTWRQFAIGVYCSHACRIVYAGPLQLTWLREFADEWPAA